MSDLSTNFKDDVLNTSVNQKRRYQMIYNSDGTVSFEDVTNYSQVGSEYGANEVNEERNAINGKQDKITGAASTIATSNLTANRALISNGSGKVAESAITSTELGYLDGVKSNVQNQIDTLNSNLSQNQNGIFQLPNGLIIQWGSFTATYQNANICLDNVIFDKTFKNTPCIMLTIQLTTSANTLSWKAGIANKSNSGFNCICADADSHFSDAYTPYVYWLAVGY